MATLPQATTTVDDTSGAAASGTDLLCLWFPATTNADGKPRQFGSAKALYEFHGYNEGVEYLALHQQQTGKPVLGCGLPIATPGVVSRVDTSGNTGSSVVTVSAGADGVLAEHGGHVEVERGGTVGTDQIILLVSADDGRTQRRVRLGTGNSYTLQYLGVGLAFGAGTLATGDVIATWHGSAPKVDDAGMALARAKLAEQQKQFRSILLIGDLADSDKAQAYVDELNAYETENERFVYGRAAVYDRLPQAEMSRQTVRMTGSPTLTFAEVGATGDTITRSAGSWITDGFAAGDWITVTGSASNNVSGKIASLTATVITLDTTDLAAEVAAAGCTVVGTPRLTFAEVGATGDTITRSRGSFLTDGFRVGDRITVTGTASNNFTSALVTAVTATVLTLDTQDLTAEELGSSAVTLTSGQTKAAWMAELDEEFESIDDEFRINLGAGRGRVRSPFTGWYARRPVQWAASLREYQHDLHVATWRKSDGPTGFDLFDEDGNLVEWDDRVDGEAGVGARFTCFRTWGNGPNGAFIALDLTRASDGSILGHTAKVAVTNLACTIVQRNTENAAIGRDLVLNSDGTATKESLSSFELAVNSQLENELLVDKLGEGQRASQALWSADPTTLFNVAEPTLVGSTELNHNGTVHSVNSRVRVRTAGQ